MPTDRPRTPASHDVDPEFLALPLRRLADAALSTARAAGATHADFRLERLCSQHISVRDGQVETAADSIGIGYAVRVVVDGTWGFAGGYLLDPDAVRAVSRQAVQVARALKSVVGERVERSDEP
ncbi:MAG: DNA gyrase modulator, partial [Nakamurella sp.]